MQMKSPFYKFFENTITTKKNHSNITETLKFLISKVHRIIIIAIFVSF